MTTARKLIKGSLRLINAIAANEEPSAEDTDITISALNGMLDSMANDLLNVYTFTPYRFLLEAGKTDYLLGPALDSAGIATGADWVVERPMRIEQAKVMLYPSVVCEPGPGPEPEPGGCVLVSSNLDASTVDLWHFDEDSGSATINPEISYVNAENIDISTTYTLVPGACGNSLRSVKFQGGNIELAAPFSNGETGVTTEFAVFNEGTYYPETGDFAEFFRGIAFPWMTLYNAEIVGYKVHNELWLSSTTNHLTDTFAKIPLAVDEWTAVAIQIDFNAEVVKVFGNGVLIEEKPFDKGTYGNGIWYYAAPDFLAASFNLGDNAEDLRLDEFRRSDAILYPGVEYDYLQEAGGGGGEPVEPGTGTCVIGCTPDTLFLPVRKLSSSEYAGLRLRCLPNQWPTAFYDSGSYPTRKLSFWPVPQQQNGVELWLWEPFSIFSNLDEELNFPPGYERYIRYKLAIEISPEFGKELAQSLVKSYEEAQANVKKMNQTHPRTYASQSGALLNPGGSGFAYTDTYPVGTISRSW